MNCNQYNIYECDNTKCGLRFPGYEGYPKWNLCPLCRSKTHVVELTTPYSNQKSNIKRNISFQIEVFVDNIRSALNVGSIFRTADGVGVQKIYLCGITPTPDNPKVRKSSLGAENSVKWQKYNNGLAIANELRKQNIQIWALEDLPISVPLYELDYKPSDMPVILVVGNEVTGVDPGIIKICDKVVSIPMFGKKSSYNVAIAFGIAISFLFYRSWINSTEDWPQ